MTSKATPSHSELKMPKKDIDIDDSVFQQRVAALARKLGKDEFEFIKNQTGILAREVARMTPPYAVYPTLTNSASVGSAKDIAAGKGAVAKDLYKICSTRKSPVIRWAMSTFGLGPVVFETQVAAGVITNIKDLSNWHGKNQGLNNRTKWLPVASRYWVSEILFNKYRIQEQKKVGTAKSAFYKAAIQLGAKVTAPAAVKNNIFNSGGGGAMKRGAGGSSGIITGKAGGLFHTNKFLPMLRKNRLIKAVKRGEFLMRKAAKDSKFKVV